MPEGAAKPASLPPDLQIVEMVMAQFRSRLTHVAAALKLPDLLTDGPKSAAELAPVTGTNPRALHRAMRTMASLGFFTEDAAHRFTLLPLGAALRAGTPGYATALMLGGEWVTSAIDQFLYSVQTGKTGFEKAHGKPLFDLLATHPVEASLFNDMMVGFHGEEPPAVAEAYDFSVFETIADVGGSTGNLLTTILNRHASPRGILFDLDHVVREAPPLIAQRGLSDRIAIESGSFFDRVPAADAHIMSHIIHDWNEEQCLAILGNSRGTLTPGGKLLLVEMVLPDGDAPHPGKMLDMAMLSVPGGEERTPSEYGELLDKAGFRLTRVVSTMSPVSIVEAVPA